jgi:hypothetical protein
VEDGEREVFFVSSSRRPGLRGVQTLMTGEKVIATGSVERRLIDCVDAAPSDVIEMHYVENKVCTK